MGYNFVQANNLHIFVSDDNKDDDDEVIEHDLFLFATTINEFSR